MFFKKGVIKPFSSPYPGRPLKIRLLLLLALICLPGCELIKKKTEIPGASNGILHSSIMPVNTVSVEIYFIRVAPQQQSTLRQLWMEVDEQILEPQFRHQLRNEGIRVGVLGAYLSTPLSQLISVTADISEGTLHEHEGMSEVSVADIPMDSNVTRHYRNLIPGMSASLPPFEDAIDELSRFWKENGKICGKTYQSARGLIRLSADAKPNGTAHFKLIPELEHGNSKTKIKSHNGVFFQETGKPREIFENLMIGLDLLPGQWIILGPTSSQCSGIGRDFFIRETEKNEQKIIAIRLVRMQSDRSKNGTELPKPTHSADDSLPERL